MTESYFTCLTAAGAAAFANAPITGKPVDFATIAVGDGAGSYSAMTYAEMRTRSGLINEVWRGPINHITNDDVNSNWIVMETLIPAVDGNFEIREVGAFNADGVLLAIGKYPLTYKPKLDQGAAKDLYIKMILEVTDTGLVELKVDPTIVMASRQHVADQLAAEKYSKIKGAQYPSASAAIEDHGAASGTDYDAGNLQKAIASIGSSPSTINIPGDITIRTNMTTPGHAHIEASAGALITVDGCTVTFGSFWAPSRKVFNCINGGKVLFKRGGVLNLHVAWFGTDSDAGNLAINAHEAGGEVVILPGIYDWADVVCEKEGVTLVSVTPPMSHIHTSNLITVIRTQPDGSTCIRFKRQACKIKGIYFDGGGYAPKVGTGGLYPQDNLSACVTSFTDTYGGSSNLNFEDVTFRNAHRAIYARTLVHAAFNNVTWSNCGNGDTTAAIYAYNGNSAGTNCSDWNFSQCTWEPLAGDQIYSDSSGTGVDNAGWYFNTPKAEGGGGVFLTGKLLLVHFMGGYLRNSSGRDCVNLIGQQIKFFGTNLTASASNRAVFIQGSYNVFIGLEVLCGSAPDKACIEVIGSRNTAIGVKLTGHSPAVSLEGGENTNLGNADVIAQGTEQPTEGHWERGDTILNANPSSSESTPFAWQCVSAGTPGTWREIVPAKAVIVTEGIDVSAATPICRVSSTGMSNLDTYGGLVVVTARLTLYADTNTATYVLLVAKSALGSNVVEIAKDGLTSGSASSFPSFTFTLVDNELVATPVGATVGTKYFYVEAGAGPIAVQNIPT